MMTHHVSILVFFGDDVCVCEPMFATQQVSGPCGVGGVNSCRINHHPDTVTSDLLCIVLCGAAVRWGSSSDTEQMTCSVCDLFISSCSFQRDDDESRLETSWNPVPLIRGEHTPDAAWAPGGRRPLGPGEFNEACAPQRRSLHVNINRSREYAAGARTNHTLQLR